MDWCCLSSRSSQQAKFSEAGVSHVPNNDTLCLPPHAGVKVGTVGDVVVQEFQEHVAFLALVADDVAGEL